MPKEWNLEGMYAESWHVRGGVSLHHAQRSYLRRR